MSLFAFQRRVAALLTVHLILVAVLGVPRSERQGGKEEVKSWKAGREFSATYYSGCPSIIYTVLLIFLILSSVGCQALDLKVECVSLY